MNSIEKQIEIGKEILRKEGITFSLFKAVVSVLLVKPKFDDDFWVWLYECYAEGVSAYKESIEDWASEHFADFTIANNSTELRQKHWIDAQYKPLENVAVLVFIPDEDNHITAGMWDVSQKWVLLDEYRSSDCAVTHWMELPAPPKPKKQ